MHQLSTTTNKAEHCMNTAKTFAVDVFRSVPPCWFSGKSRLHQDGACQALKIRELIRAPDQGCINW
jgi:hypothetical protein